jgi:hypothetical protein
VNLVIDLNPNISQLPTWTYIPEGEGRTNSISASSGQSPLSGVQYAGRNSGKMDENICAILALDSASPRL